MEAKQTKLTQEELAVGTRIYYRGDMANVSGYGVITKHRPATRFSPWTLDVRMDDGREMRGLWIQNFGRADRGGHRFMLLSDYKAEQQARFARFVRSAEAQGVRLPQ